MKKTNTITQDVKTNKHFLWFILAGILEVVALYTVVYMLPYLGLWYAGSFGTSFVGIFDQSNTMLMGMYVLPLMFTFAAIFLAYLKLARLIWSITYKTSDVVPDAPIISNSTIVGNARSGNSKGACIDIDAHTKSCIVEEVAKYEEIQTKKVIEDIKSDDDFIASIAEEVAKYEDTQNKQILVDLEDDDNLVASITQEVAKEEEFKDKQVEDQVEEEYK